MWGKIIAYAGKYGIRAVKWCWNHKSELIAAGTGAYQIINNMFN